MAYNYLGDLNVAHIENPDERRVTAALRASKIGVYEWDPKPDTVFWDHRMYELFGIPPGEPLDYETVDARIHPDDREMHANLVQQAIDPKGNGRLEVIYRVFPRDGQPMRWLDVVGDTFFKDGEPVRLIGTVQDITAQRAAEERNKLLINELEHRVKNTLATAIAVTNLSRQGRTNIDDYFTSIDSRLRSLASSHDLLRKSDWSAVKFNNLVTRAAKSLLGPNEKKVTVSGDALLIPGPNVMTMGMALHELLTNAAKYGALSQPNGNIHIQVTVASEQATITWQEIGGPPIEQSPKRRKGFGTTLLDQILPAEINGSASRQFNKDGLVFELKIRLNKESKI